MRCSSLGSMAAVGFWVYFLTECISGLGVLYFRCPPFFPPVGTSAGVCSLLPYDQVLRYTSCSAGVGAGAGACAGAGAGSGSGAGVTPVVISAGVE